MWTSGALSEAALLNGLKLMLYQRHSKKMISGRRQGFVA
jgi:hypothetical protein